MRHLTIRRVYARYRRYLDLCTAEFMNVDISIRAAGEDAVETDFLRRGSHLVSLEARRVEMDVSLMRRWFGTIRGV